MKIIRILQSALIVAIFLCLSVHTAAAGNPYAIDLSPIGDVGKQMGEWAAEQQRLKLEQQRLKLEQQKFELEQQKYGTEQRIIEEHVSANNAQAVPTTPTTMLSKDGSFKITLPAGWVQASPTFPSWKLFAKNPLIDAYLLMSSLNNADIQNWQVLAESLKVELMGNLSQSASSEMRKIEANGFDALQVDIGGTAKNGMKLHYLETFIKTDKQLVQLLIWCVESRFTAYRSEFESLSGGLQM